MEDSRKTRLSPLEKAQVINNDFRFLGKKMKGFDMTEANFRGSFAEIGIGQETARLFFTAYSSGKTIIKTMSAFGKSCSNAIYGPTDSHVSQERLLDMFDHDYELAVTRSLDEEEKEELEGIPVRYFVLANTVAADRDGWVGVRVQASGNGLEHDDSCEVVDYILHINLLSDDKNTKMKVAGNLGANLIFGAFLHSSCKNYTDDDLVQGLFDGITLPELRIDYMVVRKRNLVIPKKEGLSKKIYRDLYPAECLKLSRELTISLVKRVSTRVAIFEPGREWRPATTYDAVERTDALVITGTALGGSSGLELENELLSSASKDFSHRIEKSLRDLAEKSNKDRNVSKPKRVRTAIQLPVIRPADYGELEAIYISPVCELKDIRKERLRKISAVPAKLIYNQLEAITSNNHLAFLTEFVAPSELVKFFRSKNSRLWRYTSHPLDIAYAFRADQLINILVDVLKRTEDRDPIEVVGSLVRRQAQIYVYPCTMRALKRQTKAGLDLTSAFEDSFLANNTSEDDSIAKAVMLLYLKPGFRNILTHLNDAGRLIHLEGKPEFMDMESRSV